MSRYCLSPDRLFDRRWRPGHPFRPKTGRARKLGMAALLLLLCLIIGGYAYLTDSDRVRSMAEGYLSSLVGGRVKVGGATLSIFEGLRLDDVQVFVDDEAPGASGGGNAPGGNAPGTRPSTIPAAASAADALVFSARSFVISYDPGTMLRGELMATKIVAEKPHVRLTQDVRSGAWNFARLGQDRRGRPQVRSAKPFKTALLPELLLRNARVEIAELRGGTKSVLGYIAIDGRLTPTSGPSGSAGMAGAGAEPQGLDFVLQSRGVSDAMGPLASGSVDLTTGHVAARLGQFEFGHDIRSLLLSGPREWTDRHSLAGRVDIPWLEYTPGREAKDTKDGKEVKPRFTIRMALQRVDLAIPVEEWTSAHEAARRADAREALLMVRRAYGMGGFRAPADVLAGLLEPSPVQLRDVAGTFEFTQDGIAIKHVNGRLEGNGFQVDGRIDGYSPDAAVALRVSSPESENLQVPAAPRYVWSLPRDLREVYDLLHPQGACRLEIDVTRPSTGAAVQTAGRVEILNGQFVFKEFPYPLRDVTGRVSFGRDPADGRDWVQLEEVRGRGVPDGPNGNATLTVNGRIGPLGPGLPEPSLDLTIRADDIRSEPALSRAFSPELRQALSLFDAPGKGQFPQFHGAFTTHVLRKAGGHQKITYDTDIHLAEADAALVGFPYPVRQVTADVRVRDGYVDVVNAEMRRGDMSVKVAGRVTWTTDAPATLATTTLATTTAPATNPSTRPTPTELTVTVRNLPVDEALLAALPADCADWIRKTGVKALLDVDGKLHASSLEISPAGPAGPGSPDGSPAPAAHPAAPALGYDLAITLHDGSVRPGNGSFVVSDVGGKLHLTRERMDLIELHGRRGKAALTARGGVTWPGEMPQLVLTASAKELLLEPALYALLPEAARKAWDELQPAGTLDADIAYATNPDAARPGETVRIDLTQSGANPSTHPAATRNADSALPPGFRATLKPRALSATMRTIPYALDHITGTIDVRPGRVTLTDISARHGPANFALSGTGTIDPVPAWDLKVAGHDVEADADLRRALPPALASLCDSLKLKGKLGFTLDPLAYRPPPDVPGAPGAPGTAGAASEPEVDLRGAVTFGAASLDVGVPLTGVTGVLNFDAAVRQGRLQSLAGALDLASLRMADREVTEFKAAMLKPADRPELQISRMRGGVAGGDLAGQVSVVFPDDGPSRYGMSLVVRNADVKELAGEKDQNLSGRLTASLALEGAWDKPDARRGRGDVVVAGKEMYRIPLILGMLQVTNLSLPISSPFKSGVARYSVEGQKVAFEKIELRSDNMVMSGDGKLDFATRQVRMSFVTDNPGGFQIPFVQDLWRGAQHELLRIQVRGTVQDPKVQASSMGTLWTTVDEVFRGDNADDRKPARSRRRRNDP